MTKITGSTMKPEDPQQVAMQAKGRTKAGFYFYECRLCGEKYIPRDVRDGLGHGMTAISSVALRALNRCPEKSDPITPPENIVHACQRGGSGRAELIGWFPVEEAT